MENVKGLAVPTNSASCAFYPAPQADCVGEQIAFTQEEGGKEREKCKFSVNQKAQAE